MVNLNERIQVGLIGCGGMGRGNLANCARYADVAVAGVCDVWPARREAALAQYKNTARPYRDYREMLQSPAIDAVIIGTPPHWHALQAIHAAEAGKDFYVQKPMTIYLDEALAVKRAAEKHGRISQVGTQVHAGANYRRVVEWVRSGRLGAIGVVRTFMVENHGLEGIGNTPNSEPPKGFDWELWVGPGRMRPFNELIVRGASTNCSFMDYSGGYTPGMAPHVIDLPYWALDLDFPLLTTCSGGRYTLRDAGDAYDTQEVVWQYPKLTMTWMMSLVNSYGFDFQGKGGIGRRLGAYFHGVNGTLRADYGTHQIVPEGDRMKLAPPPEPSIPPSPGHEREWLDSIKSRRQPSCNVSYHYKLDAAIGLANIAYRLGRSVRFDPKTEKIIGDPEAAKLARPVYREPWRFPSQYVE
jgi:predicted dehydrogenase